MPIQQTLLHNLHLQLGAKMTEFAGYQMPLQYSEGIIKEHLHCRSKAGFFDISHMGQFWLTGNHAALALETLTPSNISGLSVGQQQYTVLTNAEGGIIDDVIITRFEEGFLLVVNAACKDKDLAHLQQQLPSECQLRVLTEQSLIALQGQDALKVLQTLTPEIQSLQFMHSLRTRINNIECMISRCGYTGEDGFEISVSNQYAPEIAALLLLHESVKPIGLGARDSLRLEAGLCLYGHELDESINPVSAGLSWIFRKQFDSTLGVDKLLQAKQQASKQKRVGLLVESKRPIRAGSLIFNQYDEEVGTVTSGGFSPTLARPIAMAYLKRSEITADAHFYAQLREHKIPVTITKLPFVPHRYHRAGVKKL